MKTSIKKTFACMVVGFLAVAIATTLLIAFFDALMQQQVARSLIVFAAGFLAILPMGMALDALYGFITGEGRK